MVVTAPARKRRTVLTVSPTACLPTRRSCQPTHVCQRQVQLGAPGDPGTTQTIRCERARARACVCVCLGQCVVTLLAGRWWRAAADLGRERADLWTAVGRHGRAAIVRSRLRYRAGPGRAHYQCHTTRRQQLISPPFPSPGQTHRAAVWQWTCIVDTSRWLPAGGDTPTPGSLSIARAAPETVCGGRAVSSVRIENTSQRSHAATNGQN